jgi:hypothetical protein
LLFVIEASYAFIFMMNVQRLSRFFFLIPTHI